MSTSVSKAGSGLGSSSGNVGLGGRSDSVAGDNVGCTDLFPANDIDAGDCDEEDQLTLVEKDRIIRSLETEVEAQVIGQN